MVTTEKNDERKGTVAMHYSELSDGAHAYGIGNHRHAPEMEQELWAFVEKRKAEGGAEIA